MNNFCVFGNTRRMNGAIWNDDDFRLAQRRCEQSARISFRNGFPNFIHILEFDRRIRPTSTVGHIKNHVLPFFFLLFFFFFRKKKTDFKVFCCCRVLSKNKKMAELGPQGDYGLQGPIAENPEYRYCVLRLLPLLQQLYRVYFCKVSCKTCYYQI